MKAILVEGDELVWADAEEPSCGPEEVKIAVRATAINRADLAQRAGGYPPPPGASPIMGLECAGEVAEVGAEVRNLKLGDQVCALLAGGGYAERTVVPAGQVLPVPNGFTFVQAAAIPEVFATAYLNLYIEAGLQEGEKVVLHAGASGVGTAGIQMLNATNNPTYVTVGSSDKLAACIELGAQAGFVRHDGSFLESARDWSETGVDVILDPVGGQYVADNLALLALNGRLVLIGLMGGAKAEINLGQLMMKRGRIIGSTLRARPVAEKARVMAALEKDVWPKLADGSIKPIIETVMPIDQMGAAHDLIASNETIGKVVLEVGE